MPKTTAYAVGAAMPATAASSGKVCRLPLSALIRDPLVRRAFERAEREDGTAPAIAAVEPRKPLRGGAIEGVVIPTPAREELADA